MIKSKENYIKLNGEYIKILPDEEDKNFLEFEYPSIMEETMNLDMKNPEEAIQLKFENDKTYTLAGYFCTFSYVFILIYLIFNFLY